MRDGAVVCFADCSLLSKSKSLASGEKGGRKGGGAKIGTNSKLHFVKLKCTSATANVFNVQMLEFKGGIYGVRSRYPRTYVCIVLKELHPVIKLPFFLTLLLCCPTR